MNLLQKIINRLAPGLEDPALFRRFREALETCPDHEPAVSALVTDAHQGQEYSLNIAAGLDELTLDLMETIRATSEGETCVFPSYLRHLESCVVPGPNHFMIVTSSELSTYIDFRRDRELERTTENDPFYSAPDIEDTSSSIGFGGL